MIPVVPVVLGSPAMLVFIPPPMMFPPAPLPRFPELPALMLGLPAVGTMPLDGFMQFVIRMNNTSLTLLLCFRSEAWGQPQTSKPQ